MLQQTDVLAPFITLFLTSLEQKWSIFYCKICAQIFLRYRKLDHFASELPKITIFKEIQTLLVNCTVDQSWL